MSAANRRRGAERERAVRNYYRALGWQAFKVSDSSIVDVIAMRPETVDLEPDEVRTLSAVFYVEVKSSKAGPFADFPPAERLQLIQHAKAAGATPLLFHWPTGTSLEQARSIPASEWP